MAGIAHEKDRAGQRPTVYRPRRPERTPFYRLVMDHFDRFARRHEELFGATDGPLCTVVHQVVARYLDCGLLSNGFARVRCPKCRAEYFCALSCQTRFFCSSCQQKRALLLTIPPDHGTGATVLSLDPMEWLRRTTNQIPAKGSHLVRYFGAYANRVRQLYRDAEGEVTEVLAEADPPLPKSRASWARLLRKVLEVDPLTCKRCGSEMKVISIITEGAVIDKLLNHVRKKAEEYGDDPFDARAPPAA